MTRLCSECGEPIDEKRLAAMPTALQCVECVNSSGTIAAIAPPKAIDAKPMTTTFHLKRYLKNVGQKADAKSLFRIMVRVSYLFSQVSPAEMTLVFIQWSKQTNSPFDQLQIRRLVLEARERVHGRDLPNKRA